MDSGSDRSLWMGFFRQLYALGVNALCLGLCLVFGTAEAAPGQPSTFSGSSTSAARFGEFRLDESVVAPAFQSKRSKRAKKPKKVEGRLYFPSARHTKRMGSNPVSNPFYFESPLIQNEIRPIFLFQKIAGKSPLDGGDLTFYGVQARVAVTDRFALLLTKLGGIGLNSGAKTSRVIAGDVRFVRDPPRRHDLANVAIGMKATLVENENASVAGGVRFEFPAGSSSVLSGDGNGEWSPFVSAGFYYDPVNLLLNFSWRIPVDIDDQSNQLFVSAHLDYALLSWLRPLIEVNLQSIIKDADNPRFDGVEGFDLFNFGSTSTKGNTVFTMALGARAILTDSLTFGAVFEFPISDRRDLFKQRITADLALVF